MMLQAADAPDEAAAAQGGAGIAVRDLTVSVAKTGAAIVRGISFSVAPGGILGLVGESGSGKTTAGLALLAYARAGLTITGGTVMIGGVSMLDLTGRALSGMRGRNVAYVPQDPAVALHPGLRLRTQLAECLRDRTGAVEDQLRPLLEEVGLPDTARILEAFPHELSGGQQQRVAIAMAFAPRPQAILMDEPTTALDVTTQTHVLRMVKSLAARHRTAILYVSHDLAVVASLADRVAVMYSGEIVESGASGQVLGEPRHPYTRALIRAVPDPDRPIRLEGLGGQAPDPLRRPPGCSFAPRCPIAEARCSAAAVDDTTIAPGHAVRCLRAGGLHPSVMPAAATVVSPSAVTAPPLVRLQSVDAWHHRRVLHDVTLAIGAGRCTALVGESGSGKTTLARCIAGLHANWSGVITLDGKPLQPAARLRPREPLRRIQYVFQNPYASLNPRQTIGRSLMVAARHLRRQTAPVSHAEIVAVLASVGLPASTAEALPAQLSGGQRQRAAIARGLICEPDLLICDEVTSALDVSIQATIVELLTGLRESRGLSILFVAHNIGLVRSLAQDVVVMQAGRIVEIGPVAEVLSAPKAAETMRLMRDAPRFETIS